MAKFVVLHGINLNMFGKRDPAQYGTITLAQIDAPRSVRRTNARPQKIANALCEEGVPLQFNHALRLLPQLEP